jgi:ribosomal protein L40E
MPFFRQPKSVPAGFSSSALRVWTESTEAEARADIGRAYSPRPDGMITNREMTRLLAGEQVGGKVYTWSTSAAPAPDRIFPPMYVCNVCGNRQRTQEEPCPKCQEGRLRPIGEAQREISEASRT